MHGCTMASLSKRPITLVQIDLPYCTRSYGVSPCAAVLGTTGAAKCFNSLRSCQDVANYAAGMRTITLVYNQDGIPDIPGIFPCLKSVSSRPGTLNLSGFDPGSVALGLSARVTVDCLDFADADTWLDQYQSERSSGAALASGVGYPPKSRGTFFARLFARFPYYVGLPLRVLRGYVGQALDDMATEHYVISEVTGPNAGGQVKITAKDILDLADDNKAVFPSGSTGKLVADIDAAATAFDVSPAGVGDAEYPASGLLAIGREIMAYTRSGDTFTVTRAQEETEAAGHSLGDVVQVCGVIEPMRLCDAVEAVLKSGTTQFDDFIDLAAWQAEYDTWLSGLTTGRVVIPKPTGKKQLVGEICQLGVMVWWDPVAQEILFMVNAPLLPGQSYYPVNDSDNIVQGTPDVDRADDHRASAIWIYHGVKDWTEDIASVRNYTRLSISQDSDNRYGQEAYKTITTRWFGRVGQDTTAAIIGERLLSRFKDTPRLVTGQLDVKDRADVALGSRILVETYLLQDIDGAILAEPMQVRYAEYSDNRVKFEAETYRIDGQFAFWLDAATAPADYASATPAQRAAGAFWADADAPNDETDYVYF